MRKTLLIAAATLAAGVISSQAQVYSQNIVGYVNSPLPKGFVNLANPLDAAGGNSITNIIPVFSGAFDGDLLYTWSGTAYNTYTIDSAVSTGIADAGDVNAVTPPTFNPGVAFYIKNTQAASNNITFVGTVHVGGPGASTNVVGVATNVITTVPQNNFYASQIPVGGGVSTVLGLPVNSLQGALINVPVINAAGNFAGFNSVTIDSTFPTGFADAGDVNGVPEPNIPVGTGFFLNNNTGSSANWIQSF